LNRKEQAMSIDNTPSPELKNTLAKLTRHRLIYRHFVGLSALTIFVAALIILYLGPNTNTWQILIALAVIFPLAVLRMLQGRITELEHEKIEQEFKDDQIRYKLSPKEAHAEKFFACNDSRIEKYYIFASSLPDVGNMPRC
jgi:hypothetical protein